MSTHASVLGGPDWRVSSTCEGGSCIGVTLNGNIVMIGNASNPESHVSEFTTDEWRQFLAGAKLGDFDDIVLPMHS